MSQISFPFWFPQDWLNSDSLHAEMGDRKAAQTHLLSTVALCLWCLLVWIGRRKISGLRWNEWNFLFILHVDRDASAVHGLTCVLHVIKIWVKSWGDCSSLVSLIWNVSEMWDHLGLVESDTSRSCSSICTTLCLLYVHTFFVPFLKGFLNQRCFFSLMFVFSWDQSKCVRTPFVLSTRE